MRLLLSCDFQKFPRALNFSGQQVIAKLIKILEPLKLREFRVYACTCTYQHGSAKVKLVKELSDEDMVLHQALGVSILNVTDDISEPLPLLLATGNPDEEHLDRRERGRD